ncbi:MAG: lipopolysaccharide heptosyltransferase I [Betaproteobacteria bacterium]|nr:lipopolysaccharide heptosyltransferase I [Betaproteobacteria bacterium]
MRRVLLVKTSSLGDVVHNLPVVGDLQSAIPGVTVDWVVEEAFTAIPRLHPRIARVLPAALRRWRRSFWRASVRSEWRAFVRELRRETYDAVIDTQGLLKSALVSLQARGPRHGLDWASSREPLGWLYDFSYAVPWDQHAVERNRSLAAQALGYALDKPACYGVAATVRPLPWLPAQPHAVLLHATSAERKLWPEAYWLELGARLGADGLTCVLPWGNDAERSRSARLAAGIPQAVVPEKTGLDDLAALLGSAAAVIGIDTGLTHLAGALGAPTVGIYVATDPAATGLHACSRAANIGGIGRMPQVAEVRAALDALDR